MNKPIEASNSLLIINLFICAHKEGTDRMIMSMGILLDRWLKDPDVVKAIKDYPSYKEFMSTKDKF